MKLFSISVLVLHAFKSSGICAASPKAKDTTPQSLSLSRDLNEARAARWYELGEGVGGENFNDKAGQCVATSADGQVLAVSSPLYRNKNKNELNNGRVRVFGFDPIRDAWIKTGNDILGEEFSELGTSLDMDAYGKNLVVGMPFHDNDAGKEAGSIKVYIYDYASGEEEWIQKGPTLVGTDHFDHFGAAVAISHDGRIIAVGSPNEEARVTEMNMKEVGVVRVYKYESNVADWVQMAMIKGQQLYEHFGSAISMDFDGKNMVVGAPDHGPYNAGMIRIYHYNVTVMAYQEVNSPTAMALGERFGATVDMSRDGSSVIAGAPMHKGNDVLYHSGHARVFQRVDNEWERKGQSLVGSHEGDQAGSSVSISHDGNVVAVGSAYSDQMGRDSGRVELFLWDDTDGWIGMNLDVSAYRKSREIKGHGPLDLLGTSVSLSRSGEEVAVGAPGGQYARIFALRATSPPTMAPTEFVEDDGGKKRKGNGLGGFRVFYLVIMISLLSFVVFYAIFKGSKWLMKRMTVNRHQPEVVPPSDNLEMRQVEDGEEAEML
uniref:Uncharacterized protein n=1 Tax=Chaetoceros debilis TaxID=122233 RepID=A0A6S8WLR2_9STRA